MTRNNAVSESYSYDAVGNRLSALTVPSLTYNSSNELLSTSKASYTYDNNGNTTSKANASGTTTFTWDFENRLTSVTLPGSGGTVTFKYDPFGRRIQKSGPAGITNYLYDGANAITDLDANGAVLARYTQGAGVDEPLASLTGAGTAFFEADGLGSVTSLSGASGVTDTYKPFGITTATGTNPNRFRYTGREWDQETGLYYYRARYYDPIVGRFLGEDPVRFGGGINFYPYVTNNPINLFDPSGLTAQCKNCKIVVKCRGVEKYHLGLLGFQHCEAQVVDENGITHSLSGGPDPATNGELLNFWNTTTNLPPFNGNTIYNDQHANCGTVNCLINGAISFHDDPMHFAYIPDGPNSNTALSGIFAGCGINLNLGWGGPSIPTGPGFSTMTPQ